MTIDVSTLLEDARLRPFHFRVIGLCACLIFFDGFDWQAISFAAPEMAKALGVSKLALGSIFSAGQLGLAAGGLLFGLVADRFGRKRVFIGCGVLFGLSSLATALAGTIPELVFSRVVAGLGLGGATPIAITIATDFCPKRVRAGLTMIMYCGFTIGGVFAGVVNASVHVYGWQTVFFIGGVIPLLLLPLLMVALPESLNYLVAAGNRGAEIARILARVAPEIRCDATSRFVMVEAYERKFQVPELFRNGLAPRTLLLWAAFFTSLITLFSFSNWLPTLLNSLGVRPGQIVTMSAVSQGAGLLGTIVAARTIVFYRAFGVAAICYLFAAGLLVTYGSVGGNVAALLVTGALLNFFLIGAQNIVNAMSGSLYPPRIRGTGVGWAIGIGRIGGTAGPSVAGGLLALQWAPGQLFMLAAIPAVLTGMFVHLLSRSLEATAAR